MPRNETGDAAFTLTEVMIAVVLMVLALGLLLSAFVSSKRSVALAQAYLTALQITRSEAEQIQTNTYSNISAIASASLSNTPLSIMHAWISRSVTSSTNDTFKDITITVSWTNPVSSRLQALTNYMTVCNTN